MVMSTRKDGETDDIGIFLKRGIDDLVWSLP